VWWIYAELDQMAATLSLKDCSYLRYLIPGYHYWSKYMVDHEHGGVWHMIDAFSNKSHFPKAHLWKNGYHSFEHALIGYITSKALRNKPVELYYAFKIVPNKETVNPYFFRGDVDIFESTSLPMEINTKRYRVVFRNIRP
jgi:hypothetical protein